MGYLFGGLIIVAIVWAFSGSGSEPDITGQWTTLSPKAMKTAAFGGPVAVGAVVVLALVHVESGEPNVVEATVTEVGVAGTAKYVTVHITKLLDSSSKSGNVPVPSIMRNVLADDLIQPQV